MSKRIILVAGPSGSGKDSILNIAREHFFADPDVKFIRRYITRMPDKTEDNHCLVEREFDKYVSKKVFLSHWKAHHHKYGIARRDIFEGVNILSVSRTVIEEIQGLFDNVKVIEVTADYEVMLKRLISRGRESRGVVAERLDRDISMDFKNQVTINNSTDLSSAVEKFIEIVEEEKKKLIEERGE